MVFNSSLKGGEMKTLQWSKIGENIFLIEKGELGIVYAPLLGKFFSVDDDGIALVKEYIANPEEGNEFFQYLLENDFLQEAAIPQGRVGEKYGPTELYLSLTSGCNLACRYCYARAGENTRRLSWERIEASIEQLYRYAKEKGEDEIEITFHGTGEATVEWKTLVKTVEYALHTLPEDWKIYFSLVTNGVLLNEERVRFLKQHEFSITVSMDGLERVQNLQRPFRNGNGTFHAVTEGVRLLVKHEVEFGVRTTITGENQGEMVEFVKFCSELGCKAIYLVPYSRAGRGEEGIASVNPELFIQDYTYLLGQSEEWGIKVHTLSDDVGRVSAGFCDADGSIFAVMPDGSVSSCTRVTRADEAIAKMFFIEEVTEEGVYIDPAKVSQLRQLNVYSFAECNNCFARFVCAGGCHADRLTRELSEESCYITREVVWSQILRLV